MKYDANGMCTVQDRKGNVIGAGNGPQPVTLNHEGQPPQTIVAQMEEEDKDKKRAETKEGRANRG